MSKDLKWEKTNLLKPVSYGKKIIEELTEKSDKITWYGQ